MALVAAFRLLFDAVKEIIDHTSMFKFNLKKIEGKLEALEPLIKERKQFDSELDLQKWEASEFEEKMLEGEKVVRICSQIHPWNIRKKHSCTEKLQELDETLKRLMQILQIQIVRDMKETLVLTKDVHRKIMANKGKIGDFDQVFDPTVSTFWYHGPDYDHHQLPEFIVGLETPLKELKIRLIKNGSPLIVVTGPGGCGKTLLAHRFCRDKHVKEKFKKNIYFIPVTKTPPSLSLIVQELYKQRRYEIPVIINQADAVKLLEQWLNKLRPNPILLVLDDVWPGSESLVEKFLFPIPEYKILVTSRSQLPRFGPPKFAPPYHLNPLNDKDAMTLFRHWAPLEDGKSQIPDDTVKRIVNYYKVFPHALIIVAKSLGGKQSDIWLRRLTEYSRGSCCRGSDIDDELLEYGLKCSLDDLNVTIKECFMDLGSFPEGQRIPALALIDMWSELYELEDDSMAIANLIDLTVWNLANLVVTRKDVKEVDGYYSEHFVTQHDLLRDLAIHQSSLDPIGQRKRVIVEFSGDNLPKWWKEHKEKPTNARLLSISTDEKFSSKWCDMQLPEAEVLVLNFRTRDYALPKFVKTMDKLKVIILTNYSYFPAELSNFQFLGHLTNLKRLRMERISIPSLITKTSIPLKNLQKISLYMCNVGESFSNSNVQISYLFPNLREMNIDFCNDLLELPIGLCDIIHLRKLSITYCPKLSSIPKEIGKLVNLEVLRLRSCISLIELPDSIRNLPKLKFLDISDCISIENLPEHMGELSSLRKLNMNHCSRLQELPKSVLELEKLKDLICDEEVKEMWEPFLPFLTNIVLRFPKEDINLNWLPEFPA
ncbi:hypothetical protein FEM48_Zijuj11G0125500 [Ziziphus jujuba var. spinosa]|uniref:RPW8 domain-containing protein n=1 Tax=Ziziphus jujuba var. spinosa TaxID=714518 RepID=A0A978UIY7_ZIZJJ|nr:hypothetical protein FEM48_Zijuj11G0125500 [Ziziphus jujuba var. spinosa]